MAAQGFVGRGILGDRAGKFPKWVWGGFPTLLIGTFLIRISSMHEVSLKLGTLENDLTILK